MEMRAGGGLILCRMLLMGWMAVSASIAFGQAGTAQDAGASEAKAPAFEVASIRLAAPDLRSSTNRMEPDGYTAKNINMKAIITFAYSIDYQYASGGPGWINTDRYDVIAKVDDATADALKKLPFKEKSAQIRLMLQTLLKERCGLQVQTETKTLPVYALVPAKGGSKLTPASPPAALEADRAQGSIMMGGDKWTAKQVNMIFWARQLSMQPGVERKVIDETGLKGVYDFSFEWRASDETGPSLFSSLEDQLGLKLEPRKAPVETLVVEKMERPSEN